MFVFFPLWRHLGRYWPREDQWHALAPGSVICDSPSGGSASLRDGGLLWMKGQQPKESGISNAFECLGARTLPGR
jgi:hypothetical protein